MKIIILALFIGLAVADYQSDIQSQTDKRQILAPGFGLGYGHHLNLVGAPLFGAGLYGPGLVYGPGVLLKKRSTYQGNFDGQSQIDREIEHQKRDLLSQGNVDVQDLLLKKRDLLDVDGQGQYESELLKKRDLLYPGQVQIQGEYPTQKRSIEYQSDIQTDKRHILAPAGLGYAGLGGFGGLGYGGRWGYGAQGLYGAGYGAGLYGPGLVYGQGVLLKKRSTNQGPMTQVNIDGQSQMERERRDLLSQSNVDVQDLLLKKRGLSDVDGQGQIESELLRERRDLLYPGQVQIQSEYPTQKRDTEYQSDIQTDKRHILAPAGLGYAGLGGFGALGYGGRWGYGAQGLYGAGYGAGLYGPGLVYGQGVLLKKRSTNQGQWNSELEGQTPVGTQMDTQRERRDLLSQTHLEGNVDSQTEKRQLVYPGFGGLGYGYGHHLGFGGAGFYGHGLYGSLFGGALPLHQGLGMGLGMGLYGGYGYGMPYAGGLAYQGYPGVLLRK